MKSGYDVAMSKEIIGRSSGPAAVLVLSLLRIYIRKAILGEMVIINYIGYGHRFGLVMELAGVILYENKLEVRVQNVHVLISLINIV